MITRKYILFFVCICMCLNAFGQCFVKDISRGARPILRDEENREDENHGSERYTDLNMPREWHWCYALNGEFVGPYGIGIDHYAYEELDIQKDGVFKPFVVRGIGRDNDSLVVDKMWSFETGVGYYIRGHYMSRFNIRERSPYDSGGD